MVTRLFVKEPRYEASMCMHAHQREREREREGEEREWNGGKEREGGRNERRGEGARKERRIRDNQKTYLENHPMFYNYSNSWLRVQRTSH